MTMKTPRLVHDWRRSALNYSNLMILGLLFSLILWSLLLAGCSGASSYMPSIYILSGSYPDHSEAAGRENSSISALGNPELTTLFWNLSQHGRINVRAGFFATCVQLQSDLPRAQPWACGQPNKLDQRLPTGADPLNLVEYFSGFASKVIFYGLIIASMFLSIIAIVTLLTFPGWRTIVNDDGEELEMKPFPPRRRMHMSNAIVCAASIFSLISVLWLHVGAVAASATLDLVYNGAVDSGVGAVAMTLGWLSLSLQIWVCVMMRVMTISVDLLQNLKDED